MRKRSNICYINRVLDYNYIVLNPLSTKNIV